MSYPLYVPLYMQGLFLVPLNPNSNKRGEISWTHRDPACGCPGKSLLTVNTNPDLISIPLLSWYHSIYWSPTFT